MAMFAGGKKKKGFDWKAAALTFFGGPQAGAMYNKNKANREAGEAEAAIKQRAFDYFKSVGMDDNAAATLANDPSVAAHMVRDRNTIQTQAGVDLVNGKDIHMPSERVVDDIIVRTGSGGESKALFESPNAKIIPGEDGSFYTQDRIGVDAINNRPSGMFGGRAPGAISEAGAMPGRDPLAPLPEGAPVPVRSEADVDALPPGASFVAPDGTIRVKQGGPSRSGSGTFPLPY